MDYCIYLLSLFQDSIYNIQEFLNKHLVVFSIFMLWTGMCLASFFGVVVDRLPIICQWRNNPKNITINTSSTCNSCGRKLNIINLIPVIGYIIARGRCSTCHSVVPVIYPVLELATGIIEWFIAYHYGATPIGFVMLFLFPMCILISWFDWVEGMIPDIMTFPLIAVGLLYSPFETDAMTRNYGMVKGVMIIMFSFWILGKIKKTDLMAMGDVFLVAGAGAMFGNRGIIPYLLISMLCFMITYVITHITGYRWKPKDETLLENDDELNFLPMGPALCMGMIIMSLFFKYLYMDIS